MPIAKTDVHAGWRIPQDDDGSAEKVRKRIGRGNKQAKVALVPLPSQGFKSTSTVAVARDEVFLGDASENFQSNGGGGSPDSKENGDSASRGGAARRKHHGMHQAATTLRMSSKLLKESKKKLVAREKAEEAERIVSGYVKADTAELDDEDGEDGIDPSFDDGWLVPETRIMRRKAKLMRGVRSNSVERLENDDQEHVSTGRSFVKTGRSILPRPFGRRLIEDRQELIGILNLHRNKRIRKAGITETHLAILADVYKEVIFNAHQRKEEDDAGLSGPLTVAETAGAAEKGVRVSLFATTLGVSPFLFMREVLWASNILHAHAVSGEMNRATWMFGCISLCLMSERELVEFIFKTCKVVDKGDLEEGELERLARGLHLSNKVFWPAFSQQLDDITRAHKNGDVVLNLDYFLSMHHKFPMILYPALRMQELVQRRTLGLHVWGRLIARLDRYVVKQKRISSGQLKPCCLCALLGWKK